MEERFMKKNRSISCAVFLCIFSVVSENAADMSEASMIKVTTLIDGGLLKNYEDIADASALLTPEQKEAVYAENDKPWWPFALNLGIGYGVGSYVQGEYGFAAVF